MNIKEYILTKIHAQYYIEKNCLKINKEIKIQIIRRLKLKSF